MYKEFTAKMDKTIEVMQSDFAAVERLLASNDFQ